MATLTASVRIRHILNAAYNTKLFPGVGKDHPKSVITVFKAMADVVNREFGTPSVSTHTLHISTPSERNVPC